MKAVVFDYNRTIFNPDTKEIIPEARDAIELLCQSKLKLFLISKGGDDRRKQIATLDIIQFFDYVTVVPEKSTTDFQQCKDMCEKNTMFFAIGDRLREEIHHANICDMITIRFKNGEFSSEEPTKPSEQPKYTVTSLMDAVRIILEK